MASTDAGPAAGYEGRSRRESRGLGERLAPPIGNASRTHLELGSRSARSPGPSSGERPKGRGTAVKPGAIRQSATPRGAVDGRRHEDAGLVQGLSSEDAQARRLRGFLGFGASPRDREATGRVPRGTGVAVPLISVVSAS